MTKKMPDELEGSIIVPIYEHKFDVQSCRNYRGVKLTSHKTLKSHNQSWHFSYKNITLKTSLYPCPTRILYF